MSHLKSLKRLKQTLVIRFISIVISYPKSVILLPALIVFVLSYNITYDFSIKKLNSYFPTHSIRFPEVGPKLDPAPTNYFVDDFSKLTKFTFSRIQENASSTLASASDSSNVLNFDFLSQVYHLQRNLSSDNVSIISVLSEFPLSQISFNDIHEHNNNTLSLTATNFKSFLIRYLNYDLNHLLTFLYVDQIVKSNHLIKYAKNIKIYVLHDSSIDIQKCLTDYLRPKTDNLLHLDTEISTSKLSSIRDFLSFYLIQKGESLPTRTIFQLSNALVIMSIIAFTVYMYISVANEHKVRSSFGLITGWFIGVVISCASSVNLITIFHGYKSWRVIFEPSSIFTKSSFVLSGLLINSRYLFLIVRFLNNPNETYYNNSDMNNSTVGVSGKNLYKNLYHLYVGFYGLPIITEYLIYNVAGLLLVYTALKLIFSFYMVGHMLKYANTRLLRITESILFSFIVQYFLSLTYTIGIALVDRKRFDITDYLDNHTEPQAKSIQTSSFETKDYDGVNWFSSVSLKLKLPPELRPQRTTWRYKIGQFFLKVRFPADYNGFNVILTTATLALLLGSITHWMILTPYSLSNDEMEIINLGGINILKNTNSFIYYLELLLIIIFITASSLFVFNLTNAEGHFAQVKDSNSHSKNNHNVPTASLKILTASDFETESKQFNAIELLSNAGHSLDILKIATNSKCSFTVTIGLDHKILIWSPLSTPVQNPVNVSSNITLTNGKEREFWPINHVNISDDGNYVVFINFKYSLIKCFERKKLNFIWTIPLDENLKELVANKKFKILESFFRRRTVPGFLARKILQKKKNDKKSFSNSRRGSETSLSTMNSTINGNFPAPASEFPSIGNSNSSSNNSYDNSQIDTNEDGMIQDDFILVLETGDLIIVSCANGKTKTVNILQAVDTEFESLRLLAATKVSTPRVSDRIICQANNSDIIVATVMNNNWKFRKLLIREGFYNQEQIIFPTGMSRSSSYAGDTDFKSAYNGNGRTSTLTTWEEENSDTSERARSPNLIMKKSVLVGVEFVGMFIRVHNFTAELVDIQRGMVLKTFNVGHFKPSTFKVSHSEPTHCKFCGCASIQTFSIIYEDYYSPTLIVHTYKIDNMRSKTNICLRVERDPREIRCLGFNAVTEHQYWYHNVDGWELTDINMIIGVKKKSTKDDDSYYGEEIEQDIIEKRVSMASLVENSGLLSLRNRKTGRDRPSGKIEDEIVTVSKLWDGFIVTVSDGKIAQYSIPKNEFSEREIITNQINCVRKYGYKSIILSTSNLMEIIYLGNDKLIEQDIYFSGTNATIGSILEDENQGQSTQDTNQPVNSELMFISKRRKMRDRLRKPGGV